MEKTIYRAILTGHSQVEECLVSEDCISDFLYQHRYCREVLLRGKSNEFYMRTEFGKLAGPIDKKVELHMNASLQRIEQEDKEGIWTPLQLFNVSFEVYLLENVYIYSMNSEKAEKDFLIWSIFEPSDISLVS